MSAVRENLVPDDRLEAAIDKVGRMRVFDRAYRYGWGGDTPPKWVWWNIVAELQREDLPAIFPPEDRP